MKNKKIELIFVFFFLLGFSIYNFLNSCQLFSQLSFDNQIIITWQYTGLAGLLPYKDIYYPYGLLFYFKNINVIFSLFYILLTTGLLFTIFLVIQKIWKERVFSYFFFVTLLIFINLNTSMLVFIRYGVAVCLSLVFAFLFLKDKYLKPSKTFFAGLLTGLIFSLVNDQGIYSVIIFVLFLLSNPIIHTGLSELKKTNYYIQNLKRISVHIFGFCVGIVPLFFYLVRNEMLPQFVSSIIQISNFATYGKTPFIPYSMTLDNIFIYISIFITLFLLVYKFATRKTLTINFYIQLALLMVIILLEQKSIVRSISTQITFVSFFLYIFLLKDIDIFLSKINIVLKKRIFVYLLFVVFVFNLQLSGNLNKTLYDASNKCLSNNLSLASNDSSSYKQVVDIIKKDSKSAKIFSYLNDPIFYILFQQKPPYYFSIFEATPSYAQKENIKYIQDQKVNYIIYNQDMTRIADGVPAYARGNELFKYVINNFSVFDKKNEFTILKKNPGADIFKDKSLNKSPEFKKFLLDIDLAAIPKSEGLYKSSVLENYIIYNGDLVNLNSFISRNKTESVNKFIVLTAREYKNNNKFMKIKINTTDNLTTVINFYKCDLNKECIINISNIPLFYKNRNLASIELDNVFIGNIWLVDYVNNDLLW